MATYYISPTGNDTSGDGSAGNPWLTIAKALSVGKAGTTVKLLGTADTPYRFVNVGCSYANVVIEAADGATPTVYGSTAYAGWSKTGGATNVYEIGTFTGYAYKLWNGTQNLASTASIAACDALTNSYFFDNPNDKVYVNIGGSAPTSIEIALSAERIIRSFADSVTIRGIEFRYSYGGGVEANAAGGTNLLVENCTVRYGGSIATASTGTIVRGCTLTYAYIYVYTATASGALIEDNVISNPGAGSGIDIRTGTGHIVRRNRVSGANDNIYLPAAGVTVTVYENTLIDWMHAAILCTLGTITAHHNLCYITTATTNFNFGIVIENGATGYVYNNVVANTKLSTHTPEAHGQAYYCLLNSAVITAYNNIAYNCTLAFQSDNAATTADNNLAFDCGVNYFDDWPVGAHDVLDDPLFLNAAGYDFHLGSGSPAINAGTEVAGITNGFKGSAPDIGAYETDPPTAGGRRGSFSLGLRELGL